MAKKRAKKKKPSRRAKSKKRTVKKKAVKRKRAAARKKTARKQTAKRKTAKRKAVRKKAAKRKTAKKKTARKKTAKKKTARKATRRAAPRKTAGSVRRPAPAAAPAKPAIPGESPVGTVIHYYSHLSVAVVRMDSGHLNVGDTIHIKGHTTDFRQRVESMEIEHGRIPTAVVGQEFGLKVIDHAREHDQVYKVG
jgi:hypothetical protein